VVVIAMGVVLLVAPQEDGMMTAHVRSVNIFIMLQPVRLINMTFSQLIIITPLTRVIVIDEILLKLLMTIVV
jgi:hypothetical protein